MSPRIQLDEGRKCLLRITAADLAALGRLLRKRYPNQEWGALMLCGVRRTSWGLAASVASLLAPESGEMDRASPLFVARSAYLGRAKSLADQQRLSVTVVHSHPRSCATYPSRLDDEMDLYCASFYGARPYLSIIFSWDEAGGLHFSGRAYDRGRWMPVVELLAVGERLERWHSQIIPEPPQPSITGELRNQRLVDLMGTESGQRLARARFAVIGSSGTGSPAVDRSARAGVQHLVVVDPEREAPSNHERMQGSKAEDFKDGIVPPFKVEASRLDTRLRDTPASITVMTSEFISDIGATNLPEALKYANNVQQDFGDTGGNDNSSALSFPTFRVRGIPATVTRNYFAWRLSTDAYNIDRIEEQRGPNSVLFGIGNGGGILNSSTKQAQIGANFDRVAAVVGSYDSYRGTLDANNTILDGKLAIRVNGVYSHQGSFRHFLFDDTKRIDVAARFNLSESMTLRAEYEAGDINQVTARPTNGYDGVLTWMAAGLHTVAIPVTNAAQLSAFGLANYGNAARVTLVENTGQLFNFAGRNVSTGNGAVIMDPSVLDRSVVTSGPSQKRTGSFNTFSAFAEKRFGSHTFVELGYVHQDDNSTAYIAGQGTIEDATLKADPNQTLPNGQPNPYAGQLMLEGPRWNRELVSTRSDSTRLTISHEQDFGKWGIYRLAALGEYDWQATRDVIQAEAWADRAFASASQGPEAASNLVYRRRYLEQGNWGDYYVSGPASSGLISNLTDPVSGRTLSSTWVNFNANGSDDPQYQKTYMLAGQARYWGERIVIGGGFRRDTLDLTSLSSPRAARADGLPGEFTLDYSHPVFSSYEATTKTAGTVVHLPAHISAFYNMSNSFGLPNTNLHLMPDGSAQPNPEAKGQDYGLLFELFNNRVNLRVNRFVTKLKNQQFAGFGSTLDNPSVLATTVLSTLVKNGIITQAEMDARNPSTNGSIGDRETEGYEATLVTNLTKNWRLEANYSRTVGYDSNIAPEVKQWAADNLPYYEKYASLVTSTGATIGDTIAAWQQQANANWALEGITLTGNRRDKFTLFTRYDFDGEKLKGAYIGGGYRYYGPSELGLTGSDQIIYGNSYTMSDLLVGYRLRHFWRTKHGISVQLNVSNVFDYRDPIVTQVLANGLPSRWLIAEPRTWRLTFSTEF